jgi:AcrR family transcriptional regulator
MRLRIDREEAVVNGLRRDAVANRMRLLDAAERVFARRGADASMEEIARTAGVGPATLYRRFHTKDELVREVLATFFANLVELAQKALAEPPARCLDVYLTAVGAELAARRGFLQDMWGKLAPAPLVAELESLTGRLLARAQHGGAVHPDVTVGDVAATLWAVQGILHTGADAAPEAWQRHLALVLAGFRADVSRQKRS